MPISSVAGSIFSCFGNAQDNTEISEKKHLELISLISSPLSYEPNTYYINVKDSTHKADKKTLEKIEECFNSICEKINSDTQVKNEYIHINHKGFDTCGLGNSKKFNASFFIEIKLPKKIDDDKLQELKNSVLKLFEEKFNDSHSIPRHQPEEDVYTVGKILCELIRREWSDKN